ncbi:MAG: filamentous hemagglutinin N-terminal domain-containing protein [Novosphingobium sp.]|nr:filamentous hemagglutinin N-terminal domain-containing protein [Novosphingobium sp.]
MRLKTRDLFLLLSRSALWVAAPVSAQTVIAPDQGNGFDTGSVVSVAGTETTITGGTLSGGNLFHSFAQFQLAAGDIAQWVRGAPDAASIVNVVNRVTGGDPSQIDGTLRVADMPGAAFWFLNPAGVMFGEGASIDVAGAAYFSTGQELRLADGLSFSTVTPDGSTFSAAAPEAFGFLGGQGDISITGAGPAFASTAGELHLAAANVSIDGVIGSSVLDLIALGDAAADVPLANPSLVTGSGRIGIGAQGLPTELQATRLALAAQEVAIRDTTLTSEFSQGLDQAVVVRAGNLSIENSQLSLQNSGGSDSGGVTLEAETVSLSESSLETLALSEGDAGGFAILADQLSLVGASVSSTTRGAGNAGLVSVAASTVAFSDGSLLASQAGIGSSGKAGDVVITAGSLSIDGSIVSSSTFGEGDGGLVSVLAEDVGLSNGAIVAAQAVQSTGNGGGVIIDAVSLVVDDSQIGASTFTAGNAGAVNITAEELRLTDNAVLLSTAEAGSSGDGSDILIEAGSLIVDGGIISSSTRGSGNSGTVSIVSDDMVLSAFAFLGSAADFGSTGNGGDILIDTGSLTIGGVSTVSSATAGEGDAGDIGIRAGSVRLSEFSLLTSDAFAGSSGDAGNITIETDDFLATGADITSGTAGSGDAGHVTVRPLGESGPEGSSIVLANLASISTFTGSSGDAGMVSVSADDISLSGFGQLISEADPGSTGKAGSVLIEAGTLVVDGSLISSATFGEGDAGLVSVKAAEARVSNLTFVGSTAESGSSGDGGDVLIDAGSLTVDNSGISAATFSAGDSGDLVIGAQTLVISDSFVGASTFDEGDAGTLILDAGDIILRNRAFVVSQADLGSTGDAGDILISSDRLMQDNSLISSSTFGEGDAGSVTVTGRDGDAPASNGVFLSSASEISSQTVGSGDAGFVSVTAHEIELAGQSIITSQTDLGTSGMAGEVVVDAQTVTLLSRSLISSATAGSGDAGEVDLTIAVLNVEDGSITASTVGSGDAGSILIASDTIVLGSGGFIVSAAGPDATGDAGNVLIDTRRLRSGGGAIEARSVGPGKAGSIEVSAEIVELEEGGSISTNSSFGPAGDIDLFFPRNGYLRLSGEVPGVISTTSGPNTGGRITISDPYLIVSDGGSILALGEVSGANVQISSDYFLRSADRINLLSVNGDLVLDSQFSDLSAGTETPDIAYVDASSVLSGQCAGTRATGQASRFTSRVTGPYVSGLPLSRKPREEPDRQAIALPQLSLCAGL